VNAPQQSLLAHWRATIIPALFIRSGVATAKFNRGEANI
jgi:hypothetical protein